MSKICLAMIVRDAESTLRACLESMAPHVDAIAICDTGSTDGSVAIAREFTDNVRTFTGCNVDPLTGQETGVIWDFAAARNASFEMIPDDCDWAVWVDADDVVEGAENLRGAAASAPPGPFVYLIPYEYSYSDPAMTMPNCIHWRERLISRPKEFHWMTPCHEVCQPRGGVAGHDHLPSVLLKHRAQVSKSPREPGRNKRILEAYLKRVGESDVRAMYYMGVEYARHGMFGLARKTLRRYVELSGWSDEQCLALLELGRIALAEGDCTEALRWANAALDTKSWPDPYWLKVKAFCRMADEGPQSQFEHHVRRAVAWAERGRPLEDAQTVLFYNPTERYDTERYVAKIYAMAGDMDAAAEACRRGLQGMPGDPDLMEQLRAYEKLRIGRDIDTALGRLVHLGAIGEREKAAVEAIVTGQITVGPANDTAAPAQQAGPHPFARIGTGEAVDMTTLPAVPEGKLDIVIVTGPAMEDWTPKTIAETGIGGSETMAWEMARGLAKLGHRVRHYGWCKPEQEGVYEDVHWYDSARYRDIECDALIVSRYADLVQCVGGTKAKARLLWVHDVVPANLTPQHALRFDRVLCLSKWHKENVAAAHPFLDPERIVVTRNGLDLSLFDDTRRYCHDCGGFDTSQAGMGTDELSSDCPTLLRDGEHGWIGGRSIERNPHRVVSSSSPDRGLQTALTLWPLIRAEVPEAELHVYYGFDGLRKIQPPLADALEAACKTTPGVVLHGRIPPRELAKEFMRSGVWWAPTWFFETSCLTAMQAQAAGLRIVTSPIAALNETVAHRGVMVEGAPGPIDMQTRGFELHPPSPEYRSACVRAVVKALTEPSGEGEREAVQYVARQFALPALCDAWSRMLAELCAEQEMPRFYCDPAMAAVARETDESEAA